MRCLANESEVQVKKMTCCLPFLVLIELNLEQLSLKVGILSRSVLQSFWRSVVLRTTMRLKESEVFGRPLITHRSEKRTLRALFIARATDGATVHERVFLSALVKSSTLLN